MSDPTENIRREMVAEINSNVESDEDIVRRRLEKEHGQVWDTTQMSEDFSVTSFLAPFVGVVRKSDNKEGTLKFMHLPRFYFSFEETS